MSNPRGLSLQKSLLTQSGEDLPKALRKSIYDLQAQTNQRTQTQGINKKRPTGTKFGDTTTRVTPDGMVATAFYDSMGNYIEASVPPNLTPDTGNMLPFQTGAVPPTVADNFPEDGNWGWYLDTALNQLYVARNYQGTLIYPDFVSISGTISAAQHGNLSGAGATPMHAFTQITGTITDAQHGSRVGGTLHDVATTSTAGFMSSTDKTKLDNATSAATASRLVIRDGTAGAAFGGTLTTATIDASNVIGTSAHYEVDGVQVVKEQQPAIAGATTGGGATAANCATTINLVIGALRQHGLIDT